MQHLFRIHVHTGSKLSLRGGKGEGLEDMDWGLRVQGPSLSRRAELVDSAPVPCRHTHTHTHTHTHSPVVRLRQQLSDAAATEQLCTLTVQYSSRLTPTTYKV
jgi:hypothetical protein